MPELDAVRPFVFIVVRLIFIVGLAAALISVFAYKYPVISRLSWGVASGIFGGDLSRVADRAWKIVAAGTSIAFLSMIVLVVWSLGNPSLLALTIIGVAFSFSVITDSFYDDCGMFALCANVHMAAVIPATLAAVMSGLPRSLIIPSVLSSTLLWGLSFLTAVYLAKTLTSAYIDAFDTAHKKMDEQEAQRVEDRIMS